MLDDDHDGASDPAAWIVRARRRAWARARADKERDAEESSVELTRDHGVDLPSSAPCASDDSVKSGEEISTTFEQLPDDVLFAIARAALAMETRAAVQLCISSMTLSSRLDAIVQLARARRLCWQRELSMYHRVCGDARTLIADGLTADDGTTLLVDANGNSHSWAVGSLLPTAGTSRWSMKIERCANGRMVLGACDAAGVCGWGIEPHSGVLNRYTRDELGQVNMFSPADPPTGCPCGFGMRLMSGHCRSSAEGSVVEFSFDADAGVLGFTVDEGGNSRMLPRAHAAYPRCYSLTGFPAGMAMRPFAMLYLRVGDQVTLSGCVEERNEALRSYRRREM